MPLNAFFIQSTPEKGNGVLKISSINIYSYHVPGAVDTKITKTKIPVLVELV